jgi:hypothetical protein
VTIFGDEHSFSIQKETYQILFFSSKSIIIGVYKSISLSCLHIGIGKQPFVLHAIDIISAQANSVPVPNVF